MIAALQRTPRDTHTMATTSTQRIDYAANLAFFLLEHTGSVCGVWCGRMTASQQRALFGRFVGKGRVIIDGTNETIVNRVKVCFGLDYDDRNLVHFRAL
jgi:hypothetical protein